eukprot:g1983.t1
MSYHLQATFSRGELDPELHYRSDLELFRSALAECENFITLKRGGLRRRGGTRFVAELKNSLQGGWLVPFEFGNGQSYMLEFGERYFRVYTSVGRVLGVEVETPYSVSDLPHLKFVQSTDTLFITGGAITPQALKRRGETSWVIEPMNFKDGPYLDVNIAPTNLKPGGLGNPVPKMTSNTTSGISASASNNSTAAWQIFNRAEGKVVLSSGASGWLQCQFPSAVVIDAYMLQAPSDNSQHDDMPWQWNIEASHDGSNWTILDTQDGQDTWASNEWRQYAFHNETGFAYYRMSFSQGGGPNGDDSAIGQLVFHQAGEDQTPFNLTASSVTGINGDVGFKTSDIGRHIRFRGSDGFWRWFKITGRTSTRTVQVQLYGQALLDTKAQTSWRLGAWSGTTGWPETIGWHKSRLAFAGTREEPQKVWESQTEDYTNFSVSHVLQASDAVTAAILSGQVNRIQWLVDDNDLIVGTTRAVRALGKATEQDPYGPDNVDQRPETNFGTNGISPIKVGSVLIYFGAYGTDMREIAYEYSADGRVSQSVSEVQSHLFRNGISGACYQQYPDSIVWLWDSTGRGIGFTYERQQQVYGMHRHDFGGNVECMADLSADGADEVWMIVKRTINGQSRRYIEILQRPFSGGAIEDAWHLDCATLYDDAPANTLSQLDYLEGKEVVLYADGTDYPATVNGGEVSLPNGQTAAKILVGLDVRAKAKTLPFPINGPDGATLGRKLRVDRCALAVLETGTLKAGSEDTHLDQLIYYRAGDQAGAPAPLRSGVLNQAQGARQQAEANARAEERRAELAVRQKEVNQTRASFERKRTLENHQRVMGYNRAAGAERGLSPSGSLTDVLDDNALEAAQKIEAIRYGAEASQRQFMTVAPISEGRVQIIGDGVADRVDLPFQFIDQSNLEVVHRDVDGNTEVWQYQQAPGNWFYTGGNFAGGTVFFDPDALRPGEELTVQLVSDFRQPYSLAGGEIDPAVMEKAMDRTAINMQSVASRALLDQNGGYDLDGRRVVNGLEAADNNDLPTLQQVLEIASLPGAQGPKGPLGDQGPIGPAGAQGPEGPQGPQGERGPVGYEGPRGPTGLQGPEGPRGPEGPTGPTGSQGVQPEIDASEWDLVASRGERGLQGQQGIQGPEGPQGVQGPEGLQGPKGDTGSQGPTGAQGLQGAQGDPGLVYRGLWSSGEAYSSDETVTYNGSSFISLRVNTNKNPSTSPDDWGLLASKGDTGAIGATGPQGPQGPAGSTSYNAGTLDGLDSAAFVRSNANDTMSGSYTVTGSFTVQGNSYIGKNGGGDSWLYFYDDNSNAWRNLGWDDSANAFVAEENDGGHHKLALVNDGSNAAETNFPIGTLLLVSSSANENRNSSKGIYLYSLNTAQYVTSSHANRGAQLTGTWRAKENNTWNLKIIEALQDWRDRGGIIPEWIPPTAEDIRATMPNVSARQLRHGLLNVELEEADVDAVIAAIPDDDERKRASIDWRTANEFERLHPLVVQLSAALGLSPEVVDDLWGFFQTI